MDTTERLHFHFHFLLSCIGEGNGNPLQCSCLENARDGEAWWAAIYGVAQSRTQLKRLSSSSSSSSMILLPFSKLSWFFSVGLSLLVCEKAQGPGPLLQSHSSSWSFVDSSVHSTGSTRRFWGGVEGGESTSAILPSSQELVHPQSTGLPTPSHRVGSETPGAGFLSALSTIVSSKTNHTL